MESYWKYLRIAPTSIYQELFTAISSAKGIGDRSWRKNGHDIVTIALDDPGQPVTQSAR